MGVQWPGNRKHRTRAHIIAEMSANFLERKVLQRGHQLYRMDQVEYGTDAVMYHFDKSGAFENGHVQFQLKATDGLKLTVDGRFIQVVVDEAHLNHWSKELHPFVLVIYDATKERGYWLWVQDYVDNKEIYPKGDTVTLRIPVENRLTVHAIDRFAQVSRQIVATY